MRVTFLRHGHAQHNEAHEIHGDIVYTWNIFNDALLTEKGREQASRLVLPRIPDRVYSSPLRRCIQTARGACPDALIRVHDGLMERQCGHPCNRKSDISTILQVSYNLDVTNVQEFFPEEENESDWELRDRALHAVYHILSESEEAGDTDVLIVSHWDFLRILVGKQFANCETYDLVSVSPSFFDPHCTDLTILGSDMG